jgi:hypothetical protein
MQGSEVCETYRVESCVINMFVVLLSNCKNYILNTIIRKHNRLTHLWTLHLKSIEMKLLWDPFVFYFVKDICKSYSYTIIPTLSCDSKCVHKMTVKRIMQGSEVCETYRVESCVINMFVVLLSNCKNYILNTIIRKHNPTFIQKWVTDGTTECAWVRI